MTTAGAQCATHPEVRALGACSRCGTFACIDCSVWREGDLFCTQCEARTLRDASWFAIAAAIIGFVSLGCGPLGPVAVVLGSVDLVRVMTGRSPKDSLQLDLLGMALGTVGAVLAVAIGWRLTHGGSVNFDP